MKSKVIRIDKALAEEIENTARRLGVSTIEASRILFVFSPKCNKWGRKKKSMLDKTFVEAKTDYKRRKLKQSIVFNL